MSWIKIQPVEKYKYTVKLRLKSLELNVVPSEENAPGKQNNSYIVHLTEKSRITGREKTRKDIKIMLRHGENLTNQLEGRLTEMYTKPIRRLLRKNGI
jgi:hypothetical protein